MSIRRGKVAIKLPNGKYMCSYCEKIHNDPTSADSCRDSHNLIYVALSKEDLNRLINFIYIKDDTLLTKSLVKSLTHFLKGN